MKTAACFNAIKTLLIILICTRAIYCYAQQSTADKQDARSARTRLFPTQIGGRYGFIDKTGELVIPAQYQEAYHFHDGLAKVKLEDGKYAFIDSTGKVVFTTAFDVPTGFSEGMASIRVGDHLGFIDQSGKTAIPPQFGLLGELELIYGAGAFHEGLAAVRTHRPAGRGSFGFIDKTGKMVIATQFASAKSFSEGLAAVTPKGSRKCGYIDSAGRYVIQPQLSSCGNFHEGLASVWMDGKLAFIDKTGAKVIIPSSNQDNSKFNDSVSQFFSAFADFTHFSEGLAPVPVVNKRGEIRYGYINTKGRMAVPAEFTEAELLSDGLAFVTASRNPATKQGYIDQTGKLVIEIDQANSTCQLSGGVCASPFVDGVAIICTKFEATECRYINTSGKTIGRAKEKDWFDNGFDFVGQVAQPPSPPPPPPPAFRTTRRHRATH